ncbi:MAG: hypothetical protein M1829_001646 [Trizodia sp. TS-e1964]|nr:MAG: hypothetical protein M1829_001646 [Trizodia sp. TS-e1964]
MNLSVEELDRLFKAPCHRTQEMMLANRYRALMGIMESPPIEKSNRDEGQLWVRRSAKKAEQVAFETEDCLLVARLFAATVAGTAMHTQVALDSVTFTVDLPVLDEGEDELIKPTVDIGERISLVR